MPLLNLSNPQQLIEAGQALDDLRSRPSWGVLEALLQDNVQKALRAALDDPEKAAYWRAYVHVLESLPEAVAAIIAGGKAAEADSTAKERIYESYRRSNNGDTALG